MSAADALGPWHPSCGPQRTFDIEPWTTDLTRLSQRLSQRLRARGAQHDGVAAMALAVRGRRGCSVEQWSDDLGVPVAELRRIEQGDVRFAELPAPLLRAALRTPGLDLAALRAADRARGHSVGGNGSE